MPKRNSTLESKPNNTPILRKSPRLQLRNQSPLLDPKTPEPKSRYRRFASGFSPLSSANKVFLKNASNKSEDLKCGLNNMGKLNNGFMRSATKNPVFCLRRSPRFSGNVHVIDDVLGGKDVDLKKQRDLSNLGGMEVGSDFGEKDERRSGINKRVLRSSSKKSDENLKKNIIRKKVYPDAEKDVLMFDSGKQSESIKRVTQSSIRENSNEITKKKKVFEKDLPGAERDLVGYDSGKQTEGKNIAGKRVARDSFQRNINENSDNGNKCKKGILNAEEAKKGFDLGKKAASVIKNETKVTRGSIKRNADEINKKKCKSEKGLLDVERKLFESKSCARTRGKMKNNSDKSSLAVEKTDSGSVSVVVDRVDESERDFNKNRQIIGVKRKRNRDGESHGWTQDQELALQRAYFAAKPTPHFWKRVSKLVPGKSAQDCFNKINADHITPPQLRTRSRATNKNISSFALSASKLLKPEDSKIGKIMRRKQNGHLAQKTVRHILQKHYNVDQCYEADLFSVLESTFSPSTKSLNSGVSYSTPPRDKNSNGLLKMSFDKSSSGLKKRFSRLSGSKGATLVSPPVLKPVKNKVLHEKYIDQLHTRDAKRKVACRKENIKKSSTQKVEPIKLLKDALVLDANDFIHKFQNRKDSANRKYLDDDDENEGLEEDEEEDES